MLLSPYFFPSIWIVLGLPFFGFGLSRFIDECNRSKNTIRIKGVIVGYESRVLDQPRTISRTVYYPVVRAVRNGVEVQVTGSIGTGMTADLGDSISVLVSDMGSGKARVNSFLERWTIPGAFLLVGTPLCALGCFFLLREWRKEKQFTWLFHNGARLVSAELKLVEEYGRGEIFGRGPRYIEARFTIPGKKKKYRAQSRLSWRLEQLPESVIVAYHPDDPEVCMILDPEN